MLWYQPLGNITILRAQPKGTSCGVCLYSLGTGQGAWPLLPEPAVHKALTLQPVTCVPWRTRHCCCCCYPGPRSYSFSSSVCGPGLQLGAAPQGFIEPWTTHSQSTLSALCPGLRKETSLRQSQPGSQSLWGSCPFPAHLTAPARNHTLLSLPRP